MVYNPNQQTLDRAVGLALENEARLTVVDVVRELVGEFVFSGLRINTKVLVGPTFLEIIREVIRNKHGFAMKRKDSMLHRKAESLVNSRIARSFS